MHCRQQIRQAVRNILFSYNGSWTNVLPSRIAATRQIWPYLMVFADSETSSLASDLIIERTLSIAVIGMLKVVDINNIEDQIDEINESIETSLTAEELRKELPGATIDMSLTGSTFTVVVNDDDNISHAEIVTSFNIVYYTQSGNPGIFA